MDALRRLRRRELVRIAWRDLAGTRDARRNAARTVGARGRARSRAALAFATRALAPRYGTPRSAAGEAQELVVIGMGKLGGGELNFSSDIDLVFLYPERGETDGPRAVSNEEYFTRLGQSLIRLLDARTAEGFVFRVDMRLRPLGEPGPLAMNFGAFEDYLQQHGRDWERYAWVKARAITGAARYRALYDNVVRPFVYRRYLDFGVYESLREMKAMIAREVERRELQDNVKLGPGRHPRDRVHRPVAAADPRRDGAGPADALAAGGTCRGSPAQSCCRRRLSANSRQAYDFLRRVENRLQMADDAQTHALPVEAAGSRAPGRRDGIRGLGAFSRRRSKRSARRVTAPVRRTSCSGRGGAGGARRRRRIRGTVDRRAIARAHRGRGSGASASPIARSAARVLLELRQSAYFRRLDEFGRRRLATLAAADPRRRRARRSESRPAQAMPC